MMIVNKIIYYNCRYCWFSNWLYLSKSNHAILSCRAISGQICVLASVKYNYQNRFGQFDQTESIINEVSFVTPLYVQFKGNDSKKKDMSRFLQSLTQKIETS